MSASMKIDISSLINLSDRINSPYLKQQLNQIPQTKAVVGLVAQAIADNFTQEGPGWKPLSPTTIRSSVNKKMKKKLAEMTDKQILAYEAAVRRQPVNAKAIGAAPFRKILRKSSVLLKSVTTPSAPNNIYKVEGTNLIWGTSLVYAAVHNYGYAAKNIPKREFLKIRPEWELKLWQYVLDRVTKIVMADAFKGQS